MKEEVKQEDEPDEEEEEEEEEVAAVEEEVVEEDDDVLEQDTRVFCKSGDGLKEILFIEQIQKKKNSN